MKDILDAPFHTPETSRPTFSKFAFSTAILEIGIALYMIMSIPEKIKVSDDIPMDELLIITFRIIVVLGTISSIFSIARKENAVYFKWIGVCINFAFMLLFMSIFSSRC